MSVSIANRLIFATNTAKSRNKFQISQNTGESVSRIGFKRETGGTAWNMGAPVKYGRSGSPTSVCTCQNLQRLDSIQRRYHKCP